MVQPGNNMTHSPPKAMILAAGLGSRLKPWTDQHPKALAVVHGKSLLQRNISYLQAYGIYDVVINVHHFAEQIIAAIETNNGWGSSVTISHEKDNALETGGGLLNASTFLKDNNPIIMMNADILTDLDLGAMLQFHNEKKPLATLATTNRSTSRYLLFNEKNKLCGWHNTITGEIKSIAPLHGNEVSKAFSGIHILDKKIFSLIKTTGKFSIVDVYLQLMNERDILSFDHSGSRFIDVGKPESIKKAEDIFE